MKSINQIEEELGKGKFTPEPMKGKEYRKLNGGEVLHIIGCTISVYQARDKKTGEPVFRQDGSPVFNQTAYIEMDDGTISSVNRRVAVAQLASCYSEPIPEAVGVYPCLEWEAITVRTVMTKQKFGDQEYPVIAFEEVAN